ncbi:alpha/beta hydrolase, partial [Duncaniella muris]|uniref:alpha/beta hydrolase n=1 Tax=Duncaniella muris TaxID=2094150 RepID=UPI0025B40DF3
SSDGIHTVHAREWVPEGTPRGVVQIVHGVAEHIGRYDPVARFLAAHGYVVCGEDHLGHGLTAGGRFGYFGPKNGWDLVSRDVRRLRELEGEKYPGLPYVILGHSMGSFLARTYLIRYPGQVDGAILMGTGQMAPALIAGGRAVAAAEARRIGEEHSSPLVEKLAFGTYNRIF